MIQLLDADWLRGVQLFHELLQYNYDFPKINKMAERYLNTNEIALEELN